MKEANKFIKKRDVKKEKKKVIFNEQMNEVFDYNERKWNDDKDKDGFIQGKFTVPEIKTLMKSLCQYAVENSMEGEEIIDICSKPAKELSSELKKAWCKIA